jgi:N-acylglucosamine 2-epimerase
MASLDFSALAQQYRAALLDDVIPFWLKHSLDTQCGGYLHCLDRDGRPFSDEKMMWMQGREVWMLARVCRTIEPRTVWLDAARLGANFLRDYGHDRNFDWYFLVARDGTPRVAPYNIFSDLFAVMALSEFGAAAGEAWATELALNTFWRVIARRDNPKGRWNKRLPGGPRLVEHSLPMILLNVAAMLREHTPDPRFDQLMDESLHTVMEVLLDRQQHALFEFANPDGSRPPGPEGRLINPGHCIESMWFVLDEAEHRRDTELMRQATEVMLWSLERGWDPDYGGILYFLDSAGFSPPALEWNMKLWWVHCEALYGTLRAYELTRDERLLDWFGKLHAYTWAHFPDPAYGEWYGYLDRRGDVTHRFKGSRWKGCFHVPRMLLNSWRCLERLTAGRSASSA